MKSIALLPRPLLSKEQLAYLRGAAKRSTVRISDRPSDAPAPAAGAGIRGIYNYTLLRVA